MNDECSVSVALASHDGERYIARQIDSVLAQLDGNDELVISDDGSTDSTLEIINEYVSRDGRVKLVQSEQRGIVANFNNAISHCEGEFVFICDQDDVWVEGKKSAVIDAFKKHDVDLVIHNGCHIDESGDVVSEPFFEMWRVGPGILKNFAFPRYSGCCMALRRRALSYVMPMPLSVINYDHWIGMACEAFGSVCFIDDVLLHHRLHGNNVTTSRRSLSIVLRERTRLLKELMARSRRSRSK